MEQNEIGKSPTINHQYLREMTNDQSSTFNQIGDSLESATMCHAVSCERALESE
jgi:hypothetical protein